ncbi:MAG TPA: hypothetical protein VEQ87_07290 [Burkholderiales bacterium]|nr:hypothetical protein [Burkholderiales bacterium]
MSFIKAICAALGLLLLAPVFAQDVPYREGSVWSVTFIKVKPGLFDVYMRDLAANRKKLMDQAKKDGLVLSERMLSGDAPGRDHWDLMLMVEYKNWAAFDGLSDKFRKLAEKTVGSEDKQVQMMVKRTDVREIVGSRNFQELHWK